MAARQSFVDKNPHIYVDQALRRMNNGGTGSLDAMSKQPDSSPFPVLHLGQDCPVHWQVMPEVGKGRWCGQCQRKLHDFSKMTPEEVMDLFDGEPERICALVELDAGGHIRTRATAAGLLLSAVLTMPGLAGAAQSQSQAHAAGQGDAAGHSDQQPQTARAPSARPTGVHGVVDAQGKPIEGVRVIAERSDSRQASTVTGADGSYAFTDLMPGAYWLSFTAPGHTPWNIQNVEVCSGIVLARDTGLRPIFTGYVVRPRTAVEPGKEGFQGRLTSSTGEAIAQGKITAVSAADHTSHTATTDASGHFSLAGLKPGTYSLTYAAAGYASQTVEATDVAPGQLLVKGAQLCPRD
jgi:hypothetical protein